VRCAKPCSRNVALGPPDSEHFIAFEAITEENAVDWCSAVLDVSAFKARLATQLAAPPEVERVSMPPPFGET
jgi:hypothetical protein